MVLAQAAGRFGSSPANNDISPEFLAFVIIFLLVALAVSLTIQIFYLLTLSRCFSRISPANRRMEPGLVWLNLIPCVGNIWIFFTTVRLADSLQDEFAKRRLRAEGDFGRALGIAYPILALAGAIPYIGAILGIACLVCWIIYWVKIAGYSRQLAEDTKVGSTGGNWDDDEGR
jgi:hypothetical protein